MHTLLVNRIIFPLHERLKGKATFARLRGLECTQYLSAAELRELQFQELRRLLDFAYREVPYYTKLLDEHGLQPWRVNSLQDFQRIPYLTKDIIRQHSEELQPRRRLRGQRMSTGGSTGAPVTVFVDVERSAFTDACRLRAYRWFGAQPGAPEVVLWGASIELSKQDIVRKVRDRLMNSRLLSAFDLGEAALARYADVLRRARPERLFGYATALYLLARHLERSGWVAEPAPRVVVATAEPLYDFQRTLIQSVFRCPVAVEYGSRDAGLVAHECPSGSLHVHAENILVEIAGADAESRHGELVVTNLHSPGMPIIRYRTGDVGGLADGPCQCGRGLPRLERIEGRRTDFLVTSGGKVMHALAVIYVLREVPEIKEFQVVQERLDRLMVNIVPDQALSDVVRSDVTSRLTRLFDGEVSIDVEVVDSIRLSPSGKHRHVISRIADEVLDRRFSGQPATLS